MPWWTSSSGMSSISLCGWNIFCGCYVYDSPWFLLSFIEFYSIIIKFIYSPIRKDRNEATTLVNSQGVNGSQHVTVCGTISDLGYHCRTKNNIHSLTLMFSSPSFRSHSLPPAQDDMSNKFIDIYISGGAVMAPSNLLQSVRGRLSSSQHFICCCPRLGGGCGWNIYYQIRSIRIFLLFSNNSSLNTGRYYPMAVKLGYFVTKHSTSQSKGWPMDWRLCCVSLCVPKPRWLSLYQNMIYSTPVGIINIINNNK